MSATCTSCGHAIPSGQFRCGKCGAPQARDSMEDYAALSEVAEDAESLSEQGLHLGVGPEIRARPAPFASERPPAAAKVLEVEGPERDEDAVRRESVVPKGTFASHTQTTAEAEQVVAVVSTSAEAFGPESPSALIRALEPPRAPSVAQSTGKVAVREPEAASTERNAGTGSRGDAPARAGVDTGSISTSRRMRAVAPPFLASNILREDLAPSEPGRQALSHVLVMSGALGLLATFVTGFDQLASLLFAGAFLGLLVVWRLPISYLGRATAAGTLSGVALGVASFWRVGAGGGLDGPVLAASTTLLAASLLFRAWYRGSYAARAMVAMTLVLALCWAAMTSHRGLLELGFDWSSWLPALTWYLYVLLCLLSLLAFMGDETTGGCDGVAAGLFLWFGMYALVRHSLDGLEHPASPTMSLLGLCEPLLAAPSAVALAQLLSRVVGPRSRRIEQALTS